MIQRLAPLAAISLLLLVACDTRQAGVVVPVYDDNTAFVLMAQEVPGEYSDYYLFDFGQDVSVYENAREILEALENNPLDSAYMGVIGPDPQHNLAVIQEVMRAPALGEYPDLIFIYLGPVQNRQEVQNLLKPLGATLRYVIYP